MILKTIFLYFHPIVVRLYGLFADINILLRIVMSTLILMVHDKWEIILKEMVLV
jgi:hypothetical protein